MKLKLKMIFNMCLKFVKSYHIYIIWGALYLFAMYLLVGSWRFNFFYVLMTYLVSLCIAFSPFGEWILRLVNGVRSLETRREKDYLIPLFEDVYEEVKQEYPNLQHIEICIIDSLTVNACALGLHTIAVTRGAIETFTEDELKGVLLHEIAHIIHGDTKINLLVMIGSGFFSIYLILIKLALLLLDLIMIPFYKKSYGILPVLIFVVQFIITNALYLFTLLANIILSGQGRRSEYRADKFASYIGNGEDLISALYLLQKMSLGEDMKLIEKMQASHPHIARRIGRLEALEDEA